MAESEKKTKLKFLCDQIELNTYENSSTCYTPHTVREAINFYLRSRNAAVTNLLIFPHGKTINNYSGKLGSVGRLEQCPTVIRNVFENLQGIKTHFKALADKIHIKLGGQYQGGHLIDFSVDQPEKPAKAVLALMLAPLMG